MAFSILCISVSIVLLMPEVTYAWGPATHIYLATEILSLNSLLPAGLLTLFKAYQIDFLFGNISADILVGKKYVDWKIHCHNWQIGKNLKDGAGSPAQLAFAYGYLCHLAADTVAHNHFIPRQLFAYPSIAHIDHAFWEIRADSVLDRKHWELVKFINEQDHTENERLLENYLTPSIFTFKTNKQIFNRVILMTHMNRWKNLVAYTHQTSRFQLSYEEIRSYHQLSI